MEERAQALASSGRTASAGGMFRFLGSMVYNSDEMLRARQIQRQAKADAIREKEDNELNDMEKLLEEATDVYQKFAQELNSNINRLGSEDLKTLVKFICKLEKKPNDPPSKHKNMPMMKKRLQECNPCWTNYFFPVRQEDEVIEEGAHSRHYLEYLETQNNDASAA